MTEIRPDAWFGWTRVEPEEWAGQTLVVVSQEAGRVWFTERTFRELVDKLTQWPNAAEPTHEK